MTEKYATNMKEVLERLTPEQTTRLARIGLEAYQIRTSEYLSSIKQGLKREERNIKHLRIITQEYRERLAVMESWGIDTKLWKEELRRENINRDSKIERIK